jgi:hypothetical protein
MGSRDGSPLVPLVSGSRDPATGDERLFRCRVRRTCRLLAVGPVPRLGAVPRPARPPSSLPALGPVRGHPGPGRTWGPPLGSPFRTFCTLSAASPLSRRWLAVVLCGCWLCRAALNRLAGFSPFRRGAGWFMAAGRGLNTIPASGASSRGLRRSSSSPARSALRCWWTHRPRGEVLGDADLDFDVGPLDGRVIRARRRGFGRWVRARRFRSRRRTVRGSAL